MTCYLIQPSDLIFVKGYGFLSFSKSFGKNIGKNITENISGNNIQKRLYAANQSTTDALKPKMARGGGGFKLSPPPSPPSVVFQKLYLLKRGWNSIFLCDF